MGVSLTINRTILYTTASFEKYMYIYIENRKVYVENGVKCWNFTTR